MFVCCCRKRFSVTFKKFPCAANSPITTAHMFFTASLHLLLPSKRLHFFCCEPYTLAFTTYFGGDTKTFLKTAQIIENHFLWKLTGAFLCSPCGRNEITPWTNSAQSDINQFVCRQVLTFISLSPSSPPSWRDPQPVTQQRRSGSSWWVGGGRQAGRACPASTALAGRSSFSRARS